MTKLEFLKQLEDASIKDRVFGNFITKYRNTFDTIISIKYSDKKYQDIDVKEIFYKDFLEYTIKQLQKPGKIASIDSWILTLANDRADDIGVKVTKSYAKQLLQKGGLDNWNNFNVLLCSEAFSNTIGKVVARYFDNPKYKGYFNEIQTIVLQLLYMSRVENPKSLEKIDNIDSYVYNMLKNLVNRPKVRKLIDIELGIREGDADAALLGGSMDEDFGDFDELSQEFDDNNEQYEADNDGVVDMDDDDDEEATVEEVLPDPEEDEQDVEAVQEIERYLGLMPKKEQAELIRKTLIGGADRVKLAEEMGCTRAVLDINVSRAMMALYKVALPDIRVRCKRMVINNMEALKDEYQREILSRFFCSNETLTELAKSYHITEKVFSKDLISAYKEIKSICRAKSKMVYVKDKEIEKYNEEECKQEARSTLKTITLSTHRI